MTSVPTPTYTAEALSAFNAINAARKAAGVGLLAQNALLDKAAWNHSNYMMLNDLNGNYAKTPGYGLSIPDPAYPEMGAHYEDPTWPGYTGHAPWERHAYAGYTGPLVSAAGEILNGLPWETTNGVDTGTMCVNNLLNTWYHRVSLLSQQMDVGIALIPYDSTLQILGTNQTTTLKVATCAVEFGALDKVQALPAGALVVYPVDGATGAATGFYGEMPNPVPDLTVNGAAAGSPITVMAGGKLLTVDQFTLTAGANSPVAVRILVEPKSVIGSTTAVVSDPNQGFVGSEYVAAAFPLTALSAGTTYTATFKGKIDGTVISKTWSFTTK